MEESSYPFVLKEHCIERLKERDIAIEWILQTLESPVKTQADANDSMLTNAYKPIPEKGDRILKVIYNGNTNPWEIITVHFDRGMTRKYHRGEL